MRRADVWLTPGEIVPTELETRPVVVIDVLRASTTVVAALEAGARAVHPAVTVEEALRVAQAVGRDGVVLAGERRSLLIEGFDLGNSPREFVPDRVAGKLVVLTTTNGSAAMVQAMEAPTAFVAGLVNVGAVARALAQLDGDPVVLCAGRERGFALEDAVCAGVLLTRLAQATTPRWRLGDGAKAAVALARRFGATARMLAATEAGRQLQEVGLGEDIAVCAAMDRSVLVPVVRERQIVGRPEPVASAER